MKVLGHRQGYSPFQAVTRDSNTVRSRSPGDEEMEAAKTDEKSLAVEETPLLDSKILYTGSALHISVCPAAFTVSLQNDFLSLPYT